MEVARKEISLQMLCMTVISLIIISNKTDDRQLSIVVGIPTTPV